MFFNPFENGYRMDLMIRPLHVEDIEKVVLVHIHAFPHSRSTRFGKPYLRKMISWFLTFQSGLCYAAVKDGVLVGYVIGSIGGYGRYLFRYALAEIILGFITHPNLWFSAKTFSLWHSYLQALNPLTILWRKKLSSQSDSFPQPVRAALAGIAVLPSARGLGTAKKLVQAFEQAAGNGGAQLLGLSVEMDNDAARRLYESCGWFVDSEDIQTNSVHYSKKFVQE